MNLFFYVVTGVRIRGLSTEYCLFTLVGYLVLGLRGNENTSSQMLCLYELWKISKLSGPI